MTARARYVLDDCRLALEMLEQETDLRRWRVHWAGAVALLRAVGHVLDKVDASNPGIRRAADEAYRRWKGNAPEHEIFREFIEKERNSLLKEYQFNTHPQEEIEFLLQRTLAPVGGGAPVVDYQIARIGENIYRPLLDGFREGDDARDVYTEAVEWWEKELSAIEKKRSFESTETKDTR